MSERELFEEWMRNKSRGWASFLMVDGMYNTDKVNMAWEAWQASANREGYKFAPVEPSKEMLVAADDCAIDGKVTSNNIYKAMIGVIE